MVKLYHCIDIVVLRSIDRVTTARIHSIIVKLCKVLE